MGKKPNNEISDLLARLQQNVEKGSDKHTAESEAQEVGSTDELLNLLKKRLGTSEESEETSKNSEYDIDGYELSQEASNEPDPEETHDEPSELLPSAEESDQTAEKQDADVHTPEEEQMIRQRVEDMVMNTLEQPEIPDLSFGFGKTSENKPTEETTSSPFCETVSTPEPDGETPADETKFDCCEEVASEPIEEIQKGETLNEDETVPIETVPQNGELAVETENTHEEEPKDVVGEEVVSDHVEKMDAPPSDSLDEYEGVYWDESDVRQFFRSRNPGDASSDNGKGDIFDLTDFDDTDINLALSLGSKDALENAIGYSRVRSAKNGFYDPCVEESTGKRTYGFSGKEFRSFDQTEAIKKRYYTEKRKMSGRLIGTVLLAVLILFWESLPLTTVRIPYFSALLERSIFYYGGTTVLFFLCLVLSAKRILKGLGSFFGLQGDPFVPVSCLTMLCLLYDVVVLIFFRNAGLPSYNFAATVFLILGIADDSMRLVHESLSFDVISDRKPKLSLERLEGSVRQEKDRSFLQKQDFFVEKVNFVGNFFSRSGRRPVQYSEYLHELIVSGLGALLITILSTYVKKDAAFSVNTFMFAMLLCVPMQFLTLGIYPFFRLTKGLSKLDSAVIGEAVIDEYQNADSVYLDDVEMFGKHGASIVGLRVYNDMDFYELLSYALSVFSAIGAPLSNVFENSAKQIEKRGDARITNITVGGVEAVVGSFKTVLVGNIAFMRNKGFFPKRNLDDEKKAESGKISILYMAIGGELCAKIYMQYTVTQRFEKFAAEMLRNGINVGIRTLDPNVNEKMIAGLRNDKDVSIKVIRPTPNELIPIGKHSDSGIVTSKNSHMIFRILEQCLNIKRIHIRQKNIRRIALGVNFVLSVVIMILRLYTGIPSLYITLYQLAWMLPALIYTKSNLK